MSEHLAPEHFTEPIDPFLAGWVQGHLEGQAAAYEAIAAKCSRTKRTMLQGRSLLVQVIKWARECRDAAKKWSERPQ